MMRSAPAARACLSRRADGARAPHGPELVREIFARLWVTLPSMTTTPPPETRPENQPVRAEPLLLAALRAHLPTAHDLQRDVLTMIYNPTPIERDKAGERVREFLAVCDLPELVVPADAPAPAIPGQQFAQRAPLFTR